MKGGRAAAASNRTQPTSEIIVSEIGSLRASSRTTQRLEFLVMIYFLLIGVIMYYPKRDHIGASGKTCV